MTCWIFGIGTAFHLLSTIKRLGVTAVVNNNSVGRAVEDTKFNPDKMETYPVLESWTK